MAGNPQPGQVDVKKVTSDPEFRKLPGTDKIAILDRLDPEFQALPASDKPGIVFDLLNKTPMVSKDKGLFYQAGEFAKTLGKDIVGAGSTALRLSPKAMALDILQGKPTVIEDVFGAQARQFKKAGEEAKQGRYSEAFGHGMAGALPGSGPIAAETGEEIGEGEYGKAAAHGLELSLPYTAEPIARGARATARGGQAVAGGAARVAELPVIRNIPFVRNIRGMLRDIAGRNPGMSPQELAQGLYKEVNGRAPKTTQEKIEAVRMYREAVKPPKPPKPEKPPAPPKAPEPFKPSAATARQMKFGGPTQPEFTTPRGIAPKRVFGKPARELPESFTPGSVEPVEPVVPKAPEPFKPSAATARKMRFGGRTEPTYGAGTRPAVRRGINRAMMPEKEVAEGAEEAVVEEPEPKPKAKGKGETETPPHARSQVLESRGAAKRNYLAARFENLGLSPEQIERMSDAELEQHILSEGQELKARGAIKSSFKKYDPNNMANTPYNIMRLEIAKAMRVRAAARAAGSVQ